MKKTHPHVAARLAVLGLLFLTSFRYLGPVTANSSNPELEQHSAGRISPAASTAGGILLIPVDQAQVSVDGLCTEYANASVQTFDDGAGGKGTVYLMSNGSDLFVCMVGTKGSFFDRFGSLYLDPEANGSGYTFAEQTDLALRVNIEKGTRTSHRGSGVPNGWTPDPSLDPYWAGASTFDNADVVEYSLNLKDLGFGENCAIFGIAMYHHWFAGGGDDYGWPSNQWYDQPRTWQLARIGDVRCSDIPGGEIAYVYRGNSLDAISFYNLLVSGGYSVDLVPLGDVLTTNFTPYNLIIIADDSGELDTWGTPPLTDAQVAKIKSANHPIIGLGEGGYAFFGRLMLFIGWPRGWHGPQDRLARAAAAPPAFYNSISGDPVVHYSTPVNSVGIYLKPEPLPTDVTPIGMETPQNDHADLILQGCRLLWGNSGNPLQMNTDGHILFLNAVEYMLTFQCPTEPPPPPETCVQITKTAVPADGTPVTPGTVIEYTITYTFSNNPECNLPSEAHLVDSIPIDTTFVPGSATDGISPGADGSLTWTVFASNTSQTKSFQVVVDESQCVNQRRVNNRAGLLISGQPPVVSDIVSHPVECPPVGFPNDEPLFAEQDVQIHPYPLLVGHPSQISVRIVNFTASSQAVAVEFQTSPDKFGIGLTFATFDSRAVVIPAHGSVIVKGVFVPASSGHYCIQIRISNPLLTEPLITQRNIDVTENLQPGVPDTLTFKVGNPTASLATIILVVDNTCPGWSAAIIDPLGGTLTNMTPGEIRDATLQVTPPNPATLGSGCHIDVQGWIGSTLIGGIRKLDVPPVHLPVDVQPPWEEPEISLRPDPPVTGHSGQICIELQNPLATPVDVTVDFSVADFGAGIGFSPVGSRNITLPPLSIDRYCIDWTPSSSGTLHRCVLVTLHQSGYMDQQSQRNIDIRHPLPLSLGQLDIPFVVGNPDIITHTWTYTSTVFGIDPYWAPVIQTGGGDPPPDFLGPGQSMNLHLHLVPSGGLSPLAPPTDYSYGDVSKVEVTVLLDGQPYGGFTLELDPPQLFLPVIVK